jgi:hypothetical protein
MVIGRRRMELGFVVCNSWEEKMTHEKTQST